MKDIMTEEQPITQPNELEQTKQDLLYALAENQNMKKRHETEKSQAKDYAITAFAKDILSAADNLAKALNIIGDLRLGGDDKFDSLIQGLEMTARELEMTLARYGVIKIKSLGEKLDPNLHQAMLEIDDPTKESGVIVQEMQVGYKIKERLLRPALVGVAK
jgi:molecular chaperone GrpE